VPDQITLPLVANGYSTKNSFEITNSGNLDIGLNFGLGETEEGRGDNEVFNLLKIGYFEESLSYIEETELIIKKPHFLGEQLAQTLEIELDLTEYNLTNYSETEEVYLVVTAYPT
jgi:hypothetical protein